MDHVVSSDGTKIAFERAGSGPAVVFVDAAGCYRDFNSQRPLADLLAKEGFTTYTYDRRGRGLSTDTEPFAVDRELEDLAAVIAKAGGTAMVYGWSSGALLAARAAASGLPITKLALFEPPYGGEGSHDEEVLIQLKKLLLEGRRGEAVDLFNTTIGVPPEIQAQLEPIKPLLEAIAHTYPYDWEIARTTTDEHFRAVRIPTLVIDSTATGEEMGEGVDTVVRLLPDSTHRRYDGDWHGLSNDVLVAAMTGFFS